MEKNMKATFVKYISLNVTGMIGLSCYILADTFFVAKALGTAGLASLNFSISIFSIMQGIGLMVGMGGATDFSIQKQQSDRHSRNSTFMHSLSIGGVMAAIFLAIAIWFTGPLGSALGAKGEILALTQTYLTTVLSFAPFFILNNILLAFIRNDQNPKLPMFAMLASSLANIILDYVFMFPLSMGIFGAAFATGLSPVISLCILSTHFIGGKQGFRLCKCKIQATKLFRIMSLGVSSFVGELASAISLIVFNLIILNLAGNTGVAAYGVVANIALIVTAIFVGIAQGIQPLTSECYGKNDLLSMKRVKRYAFGTAIALSVVLYIVIFCFSDSIVSVFNSEGDSSLASLATEGVRLYFAGYLFAGINIVAAAFLSSISNAKQAMVIAILRSAVLLVPIAFLFSALFQMTGVWLAFCATEFLVFLFTLAFLYRLKHKIEKV